MKWTPTVTSSEKKDGRIHLIVEYTNGIDKVERSFTFDYGNSDNVKTTILRVAKQLGQVDNIDIPVGTTDIVEPTWKEPEVTVAPAMAWIGKFNKLRAVNKLVAEGVLKGDEADVVALKAKVKEDFRPEYIEVMN